MKNKKVFYVNDNKALASSIIIIAVITIAVCCLIYLPLEKLSDFLNQTLISNDIDWLQKIGYGFHPFSFPLVFGILWLVFDRWLWKVLAHFSDSVIDLNGTWCGTVEPSSYRKLFCVMVVKQTFTRIVVKCYFSNEKNKDTKSSYSCCLDFTIRQSDSKNRISFSYVNVRRDNEAPDHEHPGFNSFYLDEDRLDGVYCSFRNEKSFGKITLEKRTKETIISPNIWNEKNFSSLTSSDSEKKK